jgi:methionyl-tRNA formyltransferase
VSRLEVAMTVRDSPERPPVHTVHFEAERTSTTSETVSRKKRRNRGRDSTRAVAAVREFAARQRLDVHELASGWRDSRAQPMSSVLFDGAKEPRFDLGVVVSFGQMIPKHVLDAFPLGAVNMHPSLLPAYRGAAPIAHTLLAGDAETGVTILEVGAGKFDAGRVLAQQRVAVPPGIVHGELSQVLAAQGAHLLATTLRNFAECREKAVPQQGVVSHAPKLRREMGYMDWESTGARDAFRLWQALGDTVYVHSRLGQHTIRLSHVMSPTTTHLSYSHADELERTHEPGQLLFDKRSKLAFVRCRGRGADAWLPVARVLVGGREQTAEQWANGFRFRNSRTPQQEHRLTKMVEP